MSEQNILNPAATSLLNPDWGYSEGLPETRAQWQARSGKLYSRREMGRGRVYDLAWNNRDLATKHTLQQWAQQYENDFFTLADWERGRYFSGRFEGPLAFSPSGNQQYNVRGKFVELPGLAMYGYPSAWTRDAIFIEERNGLGEDLLKLTGAWTYVLSASDHGGAAYQSSTTNNTAEWVYFGYGCRVWALKEAHRGIMEVTVTRLRDGTIVAGPTNVDTYSAVGLDSSPLFTAQNLAFDSYRVKLRVTGTKNASSLDFILDADALEVMQ